MVALMLQLFLSVPPAALIKIAAASMLPYLPDGWQMCIRDRKKVSNKIKLMLAQYRELQTFSQFGSDVDANTKRQLDHGKILMEILKQGQYGPCLLYTSRCV